MEYKRYIYNYSVSSYLTGVPIKTIINNLCKFFRKVNVNPDYTRDILTDYVYKSIYDHVMKDKHKGDVKNESKSAQENVENH